MRKRKEGASFFQYTIIVKPGIDASWTAEQAMKTYPQTVSVFLALKTDCVGCCLQRFCTLTEVAVSYELPLELLIKRLSDSIKISTEKWYDETN